MNNAQKAAEEIKNFANKFKGILDAAEVLEKIGSIQQSADEAKAKKESAEKELEPALKSLAAVKLELEDHKHSIEAAKLNASGIIASANSESDRIIKEGRDHVKALHVELAKKRDEFNDHAVKHQAIMSAAQVELDKKHVELKAVQGHIAEAKAKFSELLK